MSIITRMRKQTAVYWALESVESAGDDYGNYGQPRYTSPIELTVRWEGVTIEFLDAQGATRQSNAVVYTSQDVDLGGALMLGELSDIDSSGEPLQNEDAWEILRFDKLPNLNNTEFLRTAYL